jgi:hypothetical protein
VETGIPGFGRIMGFYLKIHFYPSFSPVKLMMFYFPHTHPLHVPTVPLITTTTTNGNGCKFNLTHDNLQFPKEHLLLSLARSGT